MFQPRLELTTKALRVIFTFSIAQNGLSVEYYIDYVSIAGYLFCLNPLKYEYLSEPEVCF